MRRALLLIVVALAAVGLGCDCTDPVLPPIKSVRVTVLSQKDGTAVTELTLGSTYGFRAEAVGESGGSIDYYADLCDYEWSLSGDDPEAASLDRTTGSLTAEDEGQFELIANLKGRGIAGSARLQVKKPDASKIKPGGLSIRFIDTAVDGAKLTAQHSYPVEVQAVGNDDQRIEEFCNFAGYNWVSSDSSIVTVDQEKRQLLTKSKMGACTITAVHKTAPEVSIATQVTVAVPAQVGNVTITVGNGGTESTTVTTGAAYALSVEAKDVDGTRLELYSIASAYAWTVTPSDMATVDADTGTLTILSKMGTCEVVARLKDLPEKTGAVALTVKSGVGSVVAKIAGSSADGVELRLGRGYSLSASALASDGTEIVEHSGFSDYDWSVTPSDVAEINEATRQLVPKAPGTFRVIATLKDDNTRKDEVGGSVLVDPASVRITVDGAPDGKVSVGATPSLTVTALDGSGNPVTALSDVADYTWASSDPSVFALAPGGASGTALKAGESVIVAALKDDPNGLTGTYHLTVVAATP